MWRLKIAEKGNNPYIFTTNEYAGRQIWEYDPNAGTPEEREQVEEARRNFTKNRSKVKPSSDLLWQYQVLYTSFILPRNLLTINIYCFFFFPFF